jgi:hypothetical protein
MKNKKLAWSLAIAGIGVTVLGTQSAEFAIAVASAVLGTSAVVSAITVCKRAMMRRMMGAQTMLALR